MYFQARISVLKEEKRLVALQLKAKNNKLNVRTIGVGDYRIDEPEITQKHDVPDLSTFPMTAKEKEEHEFRTYMEVNLAKSVPPPRPRPNMRTIGIGDGDVTQYGTIQPASQGSGEGIVRERELHTEQSSHVVEKEKEIHALLIGQDKDRIDSLHRKMDRPYKPPTKNIGVGDGNVFDTGNNVHVHEKELRTVIIGGDTSKATRNVGVLCKTAMRDVGVSYMSSDAASNQRTVAIGVGEGLFGELTEPINTSTHISYNTLQQMNMAAFHSRNIKINWSELLPLLDEKLKKTVRSVAVMCKVDQPPQRDVGVQSVISSQISVGVGSDTIDVDVRPIKTVRSFATEAKPTIAHRGFQTEKGYQKDIGVMTIREQLSHKGVNTTQATTFPASTNTEAVRTSDSNTITELKIFQAMDQIKNSGTNTPVVRKYNFGTNTEEEEEVKTPTADKGVNTQSQSYQYNKGVNTDPPRLVNTGVGNQDVHRMPEIERPLCRHVGVGIRPSLRDHAVGDGIISLSDIEQRQETRQETRHYEEQFVQPQERVISRQYEQQVEQPQERVIQKTVTTRTSRRRYYNDNDNNNNMGIERPEPESDHSYTTESYNTESSPRSYTTETHSTESSPSSRSRYTVETVTTKSYGGSGPGRVETTTTRQYGSPASTKKVETFQTRSQRMASYGIPTASDYEKVITPSKSSTTYSSSSSTTRSRDSTDTGPVSSDTGRTGSSSYQVTTTRTSTTRDGSDRLSGDRTGTGLYQSSSRTVQAERDLGDGSSDAQVEYYTDASGGTQMRVIQNVETTYVGQKPVHKSSNVVIQGDEEDTESMNNSNNIRSGGYQVTKEYSSRSSPQKLQGRTMTVTETRVERRSGQEQERAESPSSPIKSILKEPGSQSPNTRKKEIKFAEGTVGG